MEGYGEKIWLPCYRINLVLPAGVVVDKLDKQRRHDDVDGADCVAKNVQKYAAHCQPLVQIYIIKSDVNTCVSVLRTCMSHTYAVQIAIMFTRAYLNCVHVRNRQYRYAIHEQTGT